MSNWLRSSLALASILSIGALAAACSMRSSVPLLPGGAALQHADGINPDSFGTWAYTCSTNASVCPLYTVQGTTPKFKTSFALSGNPGGEFATATGSWYVTLRASDVVAVYKSTGSGPTGPTETLTNPGKSPDDVTANPSKGLVAVSNLYAASDGTNTIAVYLKGAKTPARTLHFTAPGGKNGFGIGVATDSSGNCFATIDDIALIEFYVVKYTGCTGKGKIVFTSAKDTSAGGVALDGSNNLYFVDNSYDVIYRCTGTANCKTIGSSFQNITFIRFDNGWKHLWTTDSSTSMLYAIDPTTGKILSATSEPTAANTLAIAPGPAH